MKIDACIEELEQYRKQYPDAEIRLASQPSWPFEYSVHIAQDIYDEGEDEEARKYGGGYFDSYNGEDSPQHILYLVEGRQLRYLPGDARFVFD